MAAVGGVIRVPILTQNLKSLNQVVHFRVRELVRCIYYSVV
jgi:hypothetical protein